MPHKNLRHARTPMGHRSSGEDRGITQLNEAGLSNYYEKVKIQYTKPTSNHFYLTDSAIGRLETDSKKPIELNEFVIGSILFFIEFKGYPFTSADRQKYILVRDQNPRIDLRFVFVNASKRISHNSKTTYGMWAYKNNFKYANGCIPEEWIEEAKLGLKTLCGKVAQLEA